MVSASPPTGGRFLGASVAMLDVLLLHLYIIECKLDRTAEEALRQINESNYAEPFAMDKRRIYKIGINFSSKTRGVEEWMID